MDSTTPTSFKIAVSDDLLSFITQRVHSARIPQALSLPPSKEWSYGIPPPTIHSLQEYCSTTYNWRSVEAHLNATLKQYTLPISVSNSGKSETLCIHFVHHRSSVSGAIPLLFQHRWPGSFLEVQNIIGILTKGKYGQAYHVVAPSLPGFAFSDCPDGDFSIRQMAEVGHKLMLALGCGKYIAQSGDWGSMIVRAMGLDYSKHCIAVHANMCSASPPIWQGRSSWLGKIIWWTKEETGYQEIQGTRPMTLSYALVNSAAVMLAWLKDEMEPLVDHTDFKWGDEEVITWAMMYIIPGTSGHANI
ncbi:Alpha/Beta hydrolase protein [Calycina marina]|uniref:Alpha/Beta hydrolase protein n=1 Tax=Calycina marina TaxID=1763456 RepID=A0A9P7Z4F8_9HELO|nr:Alpha/Beta hydrolase protein [Calycina marina]